MMNMNNTINKITNYFEMVEKANELMDKANRGISGGPKKYYFEKMQVYVEALFNKYAPFKEGDRFEISSEINIGPDSGWRHSAHFLKIGEQGVVMEVDYRDDAFCADVIFDNESWISLTGQDKDKIHPVEFKDRHTFCMWESKIRKIDDE